MRIKTLLHVLLALLSIHVHSQNFGTLSGTVRVGGNSGLVYGACTPITVGLLKVFKFTGFNVNLWSDEQHTFLRFFNIGGDLLIPNWSMSSSNGAIELHRPWEDYQSDCFFLSTDMKEYTTYVGYYFNWRSQFSRVGCYFGMDYEWRNFIIFNIDPNISYNKIHSLVPSCGLRYRLINPMKEIDGFPFNIVFEGGMSFVINIKYKNLYGYRLDALNNGFRPMLGVAITTNRFGSIHVRWTKDLFQLFDKDYKATGGFLYNNEITNSFSCFSIGWAIFI